ncbi:hypothetical protein F183_A11210 [Bryobacterales bacterium F-183]|nr:hypothetical protein F183_A11210 [Bryobacterales bacterium F-183]
MGLAMAGSFTMIAHQVASKAARDGFFLQQFDPSDLPKMVVSAALLSFLLAIVFSRGNERFGPARTIPISFAVSGLLHVVEWMLAPVLPRPVAVAIYLHVVGLGAILLSGFWLLLSEVFDLREAKKRFGRIAGFGTAGGIAGGLLAERLVAWSLGDYMLVVLGGFHVVCAGIAWRLKPLPTSQKRRLRPRGKETSAAEAFRQTPLLWQLAALVFLGTCTAALLDYLFKLGATLSIGKGPGLVRYFAVFYTACQVLTFLLQTFLAKPAVEWLGVSRSVATLPVAVGLGSTVALLVPVYPLVALLRGIEVVLRGSLFRSGYEFLYTPVPPSDKRAVKTIIDVGFDRLGDAAGAGAVQIMVWLGPQLARPEILGLGMVLTTISATLALRLEGSYRGVLERGLVERAREEEDSAAEETGGTHRSERDESLMNTVFEGLPSFSQMPAVKEPPPKHPSETNENLDTLTPEAAKSVPAVAAAAKPVVVVEKQRIQDPSVERLLELRSRNAKRVVAALTDGEPFDPLAVPQVIRLLAWDEVSAAARQYLERGGKRIAGQINDALTDQDVDFAIRRRLPRLLARVASQQSVDGLVNALNDPRFEIRYQCGRALEYMKRHCENLDFHDRAVMAAAERELTVNQAIWSSRQKTTVLHDSDGGDSGGYDFLDDVLRERANRSLEHVFSLFAVVLPRDPLMAAFRALHQEDRMFRGLALEYLESVIPEEIRKRLWTVLEETPPPEAETKEAREQMMALLLETNAERLLRVKKASS